MADSAKYHPRPTTPPRDAEGRLATDLPCVGCGYNLRAQPREGACPECGRAVEETIRSGLHHVSIAWACEMRMGFGLMIAASVALAIKRLLVSGWLINLNHIVPDDRIGWLFGIIGWICFLYACWSLSTAEHGSVLNPTHRWRRRLVRRLIPFLAATLPLLGALKMSANRDLFDPAVRDWLLIGVTLIVLGLFVVINLGLWLHLHQVIAARGGRRRISYAIWTVNAVIILTAAYEFAVHSLQAGATMMLGGRSVHIWMRNHTSAVWWVITSLFAIIMLRWLIIVIVSVMARRALAPLAARDRFGPPL